MDLDQLWIGDFVKIISSGRIGKFEGIGKNGKARIKDGDKIYLASGNNLEIVDEADLKKPIEEEDQDVELSHAITKEARKESYERFQFSGPEIDLHIEKLAPSWGDLDRDTILDMQLRCFHEYLKFAKAKKYKSVKVIHGKGKGILKNAILKQIKFEESVFTSSPIHGGGALEIIFHV